MFKSMRYLFLIASLLISTVSLATTDPLFGQIINQTYKNDFFGFTVQFPPQWQYSSNKQMRALTLANRKAKQNQSLKSLIDAGVIRKIYLFQISAKPVGTANNAMVIAQAFKKPVNSMLKSSADFLKAIKFSMEKMQHLKPNYISPISQLRINDQSFSTMTLHIKTNNQTKIVEHLYSLLHKGFVLLFMTIQDNKQHTDQLKNIIHSIQMIDNSQNAQQ